jgi:hypothetical protein
MSGGGGLAALQCAATAILLSFSASGVARFGAALFLLCAGAASLMTIPDSWFSTLLVVIALGVLACALPIYRPGGVPAGLAIPIAAGTGAAAGLALAAGGGRSSPAVLLTVLLFIGGRQVVLAGYPLVPKVIAGWLVAIAMLSAALPIVSVPGYSATHMD